MSNHSVIEHRANYHYVKVEEDLIAICLGGKANPHCKALILSILEGWTNTKRDKGEKPEIYMSYPQWVKATYWLFGRNVIIEALQELESDGFVSKREYRTHGRDTFIYTLNVKAVQDQIKLLPEKKPDDYLPSFNLNAFKNKRVRNQTRPKSNAENDRRVYYQTADAFNIGRNITYTTKLQENIPSESGEPEDSLSNISGDLPVASSLSLDAALSDFPSEDEPCEDEGGEEEQRETLRVLQEAGIVPAEDPPLEDEDDDPTEEMPAIKVTPPGIGDDHHARHLSARSGHRNSALPALDMRGALPANEDKQLAAPDTRRVEATQQTQKAPLSEQRHTDQIVGKSLLHQPVERSQGTDQRGQAAQQNHSAPELPALAPTVVTPEVPPRTSGVPSKQQTLQVPTEARASAKAAPKWNVDAMVALAEKLRDKPFSGVARPKETKKAQALFKRKPDLSQEEFTAAWENWDTDWWRKTNGPFTLTDLAATPKDKSEMRLILALEKLDAAHKPRTSAGHEMSETKAAILASGLPDYTYTAPGSVVYRPLTRRGEQTNGKTVSL